MQFFRDFQAFYTSPAAKDLLAGRSLYLLRNADTLAKGLGFARAGNFYPDFRLWLVNDASGQQWLSFVDPKGIRNLDLNDPTLFVHTFILSDTRHDDLLNVGTAGSKAELEDRHVLFMNDGRDVYRRKLFAKLTA